MHVGVEARYWMRIVIGCNVLCVDHRRLEDSLTLRFWEPYAIAKEAEIETANLWVAGEIAGELDEHILDLLSILAHHIRCVVPICLILDELIGMPELQIVIDADLWSILLVDAPVCEH